MVQRFPYIAHARVGPLYGQRSTMLHPLKAIGVFEAAARVCLCVFAPVTERLSMLARAARIVVLRRTFVASASR
jgi:hypothetical protein